MGLQSPIRFNLPGRSQHYAESGLHGWEWNGIESGEWRRVIKRDELNKTKLRLFFFATTPSF
jgi:hypothetical protein